MSQILDTIKLLHQPDEIIEIRMPKANKFGQTFAGYFDDFTKAEEYVLRYNGKVPAIYINLNPVNSALLSRAANRIDENSKLTTNDTDVLKRTWLYFDIDPKRPAGISSTIQEHNTAIAKAHFIKNYLINMGWPLPVICDSGNGASLLYKIDFESNATITELIKNCLNAFDFIFSDDKTEIDLTVFNPARIIKLYGTIAKKGDNTPERPHRESKIIEIPAELKPVTHEQINGIVALIPKESEEPKGAQGDGLDIEAWMKQFDIFYTNKKSWNGGTLYQLEQCPFDSNHKAPDSSIIKHKSGAISFQCFHNSCSNHNWQELREKLEPGYQERNNGKKSIHYIDQSEKTDKKNTFEYEPEVILPNLELCSERRLNTSLLPDDHFITQYLKWGESVTDAYPEYHVGCATWLLSALVRRRAVLKLKQEKIYPNVWVQLLGNSTTSRKSTAVNKARNMFESVTEIDLPNQDYSIEGYLESLSFSPIMHNVRDESSGLMAKYHQKYNNGIFDLECSLYDNQNIEKLLASGKNKTPKIYTVKNPYVTKLYATTPDKLAVTMTLEDFLCGYGYRWIYSYPKYKHARKPLEMETEEDTSAWAKIAARIRTLNAYFLKLDKELELKASSEVMAHFDKYCTELEKTAEDSNNDVLNSIIGRSQVHILKLAMLIELGKAQPSITINIDSIEIAADWVINYYIPSIFETVGRLEEDIKNNKIEKIISIMRRRGGEVTHTRLLQDSHLVSREFNECISTMLESACIIRTKEKPTSYKLAGQNNPIRNSAISKISKTHILTQSNNINANSANSHTCDVHLPFLSSCYTANSANSANSANPTDSNLHFCGICGNPLNGSSEQGPSGLGKIHPDCKYLSIPVRVLADIPLFVGRDERPYGPFKAGETGKMPAINAYVLIGRKAAVWVEETA